MAVDVRSCRCGQAIGELVTRGRMAILYRPTELVTPEIYVFANRFSEIAKDH